MIDKRSLVFHIIRQNDDFSANIFTMSPLQLIFGLVLIGSVFPKTIKERPVPVGFYEDPKFPFELPGGFIAGGQETKPNEYPWQVAVLTTKLLGRYICGGSIISENYVLTAAHCTEGGLSIEVLMGAHDRTDPNESSQKSVVVYPGDWKEHEDYSSKTLNNDISYIKFPKPIEFNDYISAIPLNDIEPAAHSKVTITGWGGLGDGKPLATVLQEVNVRTAEDKLCTDWFSGLPDMDYVVCLNSAYDDGNKSACGGDSGGPMNYKKQGTQTFLLNGITSFGSSGGCEIGAPFGYTSVPAHLQWIIDNTAVNPPTRK